MKTPAGHAPPAGSMLGNAEHDGTLDLMTLNPARLLPQQSPQQSQRPTTLPYAQPPLKFASKKWPFPDFRFDRESDSLQGRS